MSDDKSKITYIRSDDNSPEAKRAYKKGFRKAIESSAKELHDETESYKTLAAEFPPEYSFKLMQIFNMGFRTGQYKLLSGNSGILEIMQKHVAKKDW